MLHTYYQNAKWTNCNIYVRREFVWQADSKKAKAVEYSAGTLTALSQSLKKSCTKGQIKSEWLDEIINFQKMNWKIDDFINPFWLNLTKVNLKDFFPMQYKNSQGRNPSDFLVHFLEIDDFINSFWFNLTFTEALTVY
jgi:hypothetical protein